MTRQQVEAEIEADALSVWNLLANVEQMGRWSPYCRRCEWLGGASGPEVRVRFRGHNRQQGLRWVRECEITACEPGREFAFSTYFKGREATRWRYRFAPSATGTLVTEEYEIVSMPRWIRILYSIPPARRRAARDAHRGMITTLARLKRAAEAASGSPS